MGALLAQFGAAGITFSALPGGQLRADGPIDDAARVAIRDRKRAILAELAGIDVARGWQVRFPTLDSMEVIFAPAATRAEVEAIYPGATLEALSESSGRNATPTEAAELRELVALVFGEASESDRVALLQAACADPAAALTSFRALVADCGRRYVGPPSLT